MGEPFRTPVGLQLSQAAAAVRRAFEDALGQAEFDHAQGQGGGTLPVWLILLNLKIHKPGNQHDLAEKVGIREATLTHHLNAMDARGLVTRTRSAANRRIQLVELTEAGEAAFTALQQAAIGFDTRLRAGLSEGDLDTLSGLLSKLAANVGGGQQGAAPWAGLAESGQA
jgi:MarR family transcriptional regulator, transcriptional regulator for hemolysin